MNDTSANEFFNTIIPKVLIVDDRSENIVAMKKILQSDHDLSVEVFEAQTGEDALSLLLEHEFAVMLLDVQMPDMDGFEVASLMQSSDQTSHVPIIFVSAINKEEKHSIKGHELGAVDFVFKPVNPTILISKVAIFCKLYCREKKLQIILDENQKMKELLESSNDELKYLANYDALTKIPNRLSFENSIAQVVSNAKRHERIFALMLIDLDNFKEVNDTYGHDVGDLLLKSVSDKLSHCIRGEDYMSHIGVVARMGGDEFAIILSDISDTNDAGVIATRAIEQIAMTYKFGDVSITTSISIGIACYPYAGEDYASLYKSADIALYTAKGLGKNDYQYFSHDLQEKHNKHIVLEKQIQNALENDLFEMYYQPIFQGPERHIIGFEALIRLKGEEQEVLLASQFLDAASKSQLIMPIYEWVVREVMDQQKAWMDAAMPSCYISINLAAKQLCHGGSIGVINSYINDHNVDSKNIHIEISELDLMDYTRACETVLSECRQDGILIDIDDFTSSSCAKLEDLQVDGVKIKQSLIRNIESNIVNQVLVKCVLELSSKLDMTVIAKGVATKQEYNYLLKVGCKIMQGFYLSEPLPASEATQLLQSSNKSEASG
ncbi:MAG: EAL domain-containing protein [Coxiellaceae bacterium]|nr:EAL domain-containing protein [Coxiellaceae bacterium]